MIFNFKIQQDLHLLVPISRVYLLQNIYSKVQICVIFKMFEMQISLLKKYISFQQLNF